MNAPWTWLPPSTSSDCTLPLGQRASTRAGDVPVGAGGQRQHLGAGPSQRPLAPMRGRRSARVEPFGRAAINSGRRRRVAQQLGAGRRAQPAVEHHAQRAVARGPPRRAPHGQLRIVGQHRARPDQDGVVRRAQLVGRPPRLRSGDQ